MSDLAGVSDASSPVTVAPEETPRARRPAIVVVDDEPSVLAAFEGTER